jgi:hypothetical protein
VNIRTDWLIAIKDAKDAGLDSFAYALMATHDLLFPSEPLKPLYDRMALEHLIRNRQLKEIPPKTWSYAMLDGTERVKPILYTRQAGKGFARRFYPNTPQP